MAEAVKPVETRKLSVTPSHPAPRAKTWVTRPERCDGRKPAPRAGCDAVRIDPGKHGLRRFRGWSSGDPGAIAGTCQDCGLDLSADPDGDHGDHHRLCWDCFRAAGTRVPTDEIGARDRVAAADRIAVRFKQPRQPWQQPGPAPNRPPESFTVALADLRRELAGVRERLDRLERKDAA